ncbi:hypothetical protein H0N96_02025 [Candidatus Micrarchaeota archaeon]|nr:hypothetical protein [Candidatus Micrarchaeota archaeon]
MPLILYTTEDIAGANAARVLKENYDFQQDEDLQIKDKIFKTWSNHELQLIELNTRLAFDSNWLNDYFTSDLLVFASRHRSETGKPCLTTHSTGDWAHGELSATSAFAIKTAFSFLKQNALEGFDVSLEATHHQPFNLNAPSLFIEVGSSENEWRNERACALLAECVVETAKNYLNANGKIAIGMGAGHYAPSFNKLETGDYAFSFITPKHSLDFVTADLIKQEIAKTREGVESAAIDWKGCGGEQRKRVIDSCEQAGLPWEKV